MFMKKPKHKVFDYQPRFYKPDEDKTELRKKRLKFRYARKLHQKRRSFIYWLVLLIIVLYLYLKLSHYFWKRANL